MDGTREVMLFRGETAELSERLAQRAFKTGCAKPAFEKRAPENKVVDVPESKNVAPLRNKRVFKKA